MRIKIDDLTGKEIAQLLQEHHQDMLIHSPPESVHVLDLKSLKVPGITFYSAWINGELAGCGALKQLDDQHGEIKSMRTSRTHLRKGIAAKLLSHIVDEANSRSYLKLSLETGTMDAFVPARKLYQSFGFSECLPFADYVEDPYSVFMTKLLQPGTLSDNIDGSIH